MDTNKPNEHLNYSEPKRKQPLGLIILLIALLLTASALAIFYFNLRKDAVKQAEENIRLEYTRDSLEMELNGIIIEYDSMKTENDSINVLLEVQQNYIRSLITKEASNKQKIKDYQAELKTLRDIMKSFVVQIDSLNTKNQILTAENIEIKSRLETTRKEREKLQAEKEQLNSKVELASVLSARDIMAIPLNKNSKERDRAKAIEKIRTCCIIRENPIIPAGPKEIYLRIYRPDGFLMTPSTDNVFETKDGSLIYSAKRELEYENKDIEICIFYQKTEEFVEGTYSVELYSEGNKIGETTFALKYISACCYVDVVSSTF